MIIAIDGPAGSGKSSVAKEIAKIFNFTHLDTGAMYRALTLKALNNNINLNDEETLRNLLLNSDIKIANDKVYIDNKDITFEIRKPSVTKNVSLVSSYKSIRDLMVKKQRELASNINCVLDGRDIGTVVFPDAFIKIFLNASPEERARRRYKEEMEKGINTNYIELLEDIKLRDMLDSTRSISPLKPAKDSIQIDTTNLSYTEVVNSIKKIIENKLSIISK
jgi:cytidylate kinase